MTTDQSTESILGEVARAAPRWREELGIGRADWARLGSLGLLDLPRGGEAFTGSASLIRGLGGHLDGGTRAAIALQALMVPEYLELAAPNHPLLDGMRAGQAVVGLALTEASSGGRVSQVATTLSGTPDSWHLNGEKVFVTNGRAASVVICLARLGSVGDALTARMALVTVDMSWPGVVVRPQPLEAWRSAGTCQVDFHHVAVPASAVLGRPHRTLVSVMAALDFERLVAGLMAVGSARRNVSAIAALFAVDAARPERGRRLRSYQSARHAYAELKAELSMLETYAERAVAARVRGELDTLAATTLKLRATECDREAALCRLRLSGADGLILGSDAMLAVHDALAATIAAGVSETLRDVLFEA
jgi:alkylation response protein AidB-like acyl-CoA dehydrogenase